MPKPKIHEISWATKAVSARFCQIGHLNKSVTCYKQAAKSITFMTKIVKCILLFFILYF